MKAFLLIGFAATVACGHGTPGNSDAGAPVAIVSIAANSSNSVKATIETLGAASVQLACSTDHAHAITTPYLPVSAMGAARTTVIAAQLRPSTPYFCIARASSSPTGTSSVSSAETSVTTNSTVAVTHRRLTPSWSSGPVGSMDYGVGTHSFNYSQASGGHWTNGDTYRPFRLQNGRTFSSFNDGTGCDTCVLPGGSSNVGMLEITLDANLIVEKVKLANSLSDYGSEAATSSPSCWTDGYTWKGMACHVEGTYLFCAVHRQLDTPPWTTANASIVLSRDDGQGWVNPTHAWRDRSPNGDAPCPSKPSSLVWPGWGHASIIQSWLEDVSQSGGAVTNPINGIDAYAYVLLQDSLRTKDYVGRIHRGLAPCLDFGWGAGCGFQDPTKWEYWTNAAGDADVNNPANWSSTLLQATPVFDEPAHGCEVSSFSYLPDFGKVVWACTSPAGLQLFVAESVVGPWRSSSAHDSALPFSGPPWNLSGGLYRAFPAFIPGTYRIISTAPLTAMATLLHGGDYTQATPAPEMNVYSMMSLPITFTSE